MLFQNSIVFGCRACILEKNEVYVKQKTVLLIIKHYFKNIHLLQRIGFLAVNK